MKNETKLPKEFKIQYNLLKKVIEELNKIQSKTKDENTSIKITKLLKRINETIFG